MFFSVVIPKVAAIHFEGLKVTGRSRCYTNGNVLHYEHNRLVGKTTLNSLGEPNHVSCNGIPIGYSRKIRKTKTKMVHYNRKGRPIGYSRCLGLVWLHFGRIAREGWIS